MKFQLKSPLFNHDRRLTWRERRSGNERRNPYRVRQMSADCRQGIPRRESDITSEFNVSGQSVELIRRRIE